MRIQLCDDGHSAIAITQDGWLVLYDLWTMMKYAERKMISEKEFVKDFILLGQSKSSLANCKIAILVEDSENTKVSLFRYKFNICKYKYFQEQYFMLVFNSLYSCKCIELIRPK